jgi:hypothetical protein
MQTKKQQVACSHAGAISHSTMKTCINRIFCKSSKSTMAWTFRSPTRAIESMSKPKSKAQYRQSIPMQKYIFETTSKNTITWHEVLQISNIFFINNVLTTLLFILKDAYRAPANSTTKSHTFKTQWCTNRTRSSSKTTLSSANVHILRSKARLFHV